MTINDSLTDFLLNMKLKKVNLPFMPTEIDRVVNESKKRRTEEEEEIFLEELYDFSTLSISIAGKTKKGNEVVGFIHKPHYYCNAKNIVLAEEGRPEYNKNHCDDIYAGLGAYQYPLNRWYKLLNQNGSGDVFVIDFKDYLGFAEKWKDPGTLKGSPFYTEIEKKRLNKGLRKLINDPVALAIFGLNPQQIKKYALLVAENLDCASIWESWDENKARILPFQFNLAHQEVIDVPVVKRLGIHESYQASRGGGWDSSLHEVSGARGFEKAPVIEDINLINQTPY